jgi:glutathionylspermidine synthase
VDENPDTTTGVPLTLGPSLSKSDWDSVKLATIFDHCKWDAQSEDHCVLCDFPLLLSQTDWLKLADWAEALTAEALAAEAELLSRPDLHAELGLPKSICATLRRCGAHRPPAGAARVMRFDFHFTKQGWRISEVNADVPGGFIEAAGFTELMSRYYSAAVAPPSPASAYAKAIARCVGEKGLIGLVHPTAHVDDAQVMHFLEKEIRSLGMRAVLLSPEHLSWESGQARIVCEFASGNPDLLVRFFPAEWLSELPSTSQWEPWFCGGVTRMSNPGTAIMIQSKRFPLVWNELKEPMQTWRSLSTESVCPGKLHLAATSDWVVKPVFGRVGEDVAIAGVSPETDYKEIVQAASRYPKYWVAQRRFETIPLTGPGGPYYPCIGVFTLDGRTAGAYGRIARKPLIDHNAQDAAVLISPKDERVDD